MQYLSIRINNVDVINTNIIIVISSYLIEFSHCRVNVKLMISIFSFLFFIVFMYTLTFRNDKKEKGLELDPIPVVIFTKQEKSEFLILTWSYILGRHPESMWFGEHEGYDL